MKYYCIHRILGIIVEIITLFSLAACQVSSDIHPTPLSPTPTNFSVTLEPTATLAYLPSEIIGGQEYPALTYPEPYMPPLETATPPFNPTATLPPLPTWTPYIPPPPPTILPQVVETTPFHLPGLLPFGLQVNIYRMKQPILAGDVGYQEVRKVLKDRMQQVQEFGWTIDQEDIDTANEALSPYGWHIERGGTSKFSNSPLFVLYHGDQTVFENLIHFSPVSINASRNDFMLNIELSNYAWKQVRKDEVISPKQAFPDQYIQENWPAAIPHFLGDDIVAATIEHNSEGPFPWVRVYRNGEMIYQTKSTVAHVGQSLIGLWTYRNHWALEVLEAVTIDGDAVNEKHDYQKSYLFRLFGSKPLFMFEKDGRIGINIDGEEILLPGDKVPHYNCCIGAMLNPRITEYVMDFFLADGEQWYYVEVVRAR